MRCSWKSREIGIKGGNGGDGVVRIHFNLKGMAAGYRREGGLENQRSHDGRECCGRSCLRRF